MNSRNLSFALLLILTSSSILYAIHFGIRPVGAHDGGGNGDDDKGHDGREDKNENRMRVETDGNSATVVSKLEVGGVEKELRLTLISENGPRLTLRFKSEQEMGKNETETEFKVVVRFLNVTEFVDSDVSGTLTTNDTIVKNIALAGRSFSKPSVTNVTSSDNKMGFRLETHSITPFIFQISTDIFPTEAIQNGTRFGPTETKITITIDGFLFARSDTLLALRIRATSVQETEEESFNPTTQTEKETEVEIRSRTAEGFFSWSNIATVDGAASPVTSSLTRFDGRTLINLAYHHGSKIVHDPILGVRAGTSAFAAFTPVLLIPLLITVVAIYASSNRRKQSALTARTARD